MEGPSEQEVRAHFDQRAATYDAWWVGVGHERLGFSEEVEQLIEVVRGLAPARVLDVGCGTGFLTQHLRGDVVALDQSAAMLEIAASRMPQARVVQGDAVPLPFGAGAFDRVFTSLFFHHLSPDDRAAFVREARRVGRELVVVEAVHTAAAGQEHGHHHGKRSFTAEELLGEVGGGQVLHEGRWFVVVVTR